MIQITEVLKSTEVIPKSAEVAQPGRALVSLPFAVRAKLKTELSPVQTRPSAPQHCFGISPGHFYFLFLKLARSRAL